MHAARRGDTLYVQKEVDMQHVRDTGTHRYRLVERCLRYLDRHKTERVTLKDLAEQVSVSEYHLHRVFTEWAGITPDRFLRYLKKEVLLSRLADTPLLDLALDTGLGSSSRAHDLLVTYEAMSPGELRNRGEGVWIAYAFGDTPFGRGVIASTERGILSLRFADAGDDSALDQLAEEFPRANLYPGGYEQEDLLAAVFAGGPGMPQGAGARRGPGDHPNDGLHLLLRGTNFQVRVWEALLQVPPASVTTYRHIARAIGRPAASRAVGQAVAANSLAYLVPCHRVIRAIGTTGEYRWGMYRKMALIARELATEWK